MSIILHILKISSINAETSAEISKNVKIYIFLKDDRILSAKNYIINLKIFTSFFFFIYQSISILN